MHDVCEKARKSVDEQQKLFLRRAVIGAERAARMEKKKSEVERKLQKELVRAEDLSVDVSRYGGFWKCEKDMETWMKEKDETEARSAVEAQLKFQKFVLKCKNGNGYLNLTSGGKRKEVCELVENLKMSMTESENERDCLFVCGISLTSGQLINELFPDCTRSCFSQVLLCRCGSDRIYEMRWLFVAVGQLLFLTSLM